jgi:hypothetical protein
MLWGAVNVEALMVMPDGPASMMAVFFQGQDGQREKKKDRFRQTSTGKHG